MKFVNFAGLYPAGYSELNNVNIADVALDVDLSVGTVKPWRTNKPISGVLGAKAIYEIQGCCVLTDPSHCARYAEGDPSPQCPELVFRTYGGSPADSLYIAPSVARTADACNNVWRDLSFPSFTQPNILVPTITLDEKAELMHLFYTVVDDWGRESAPSAVSTEFYANFGTVILVNGFPTAYPNGKSIRIYISRPAWSSGAENQPVQDRAPFYLAQEFAMGQASTNVAVDYPGPANITWDYEPAPADLWDVTSFRGGQLLGLSGNTVRASIGHTFHAWPTRFTVRFYGEARRLIAGRSIAYVLTDEAPLMMRIPAGCNEMSCFQSQQLHTPLPIASARSAAMFGDTVIYATYDGLVALTGQEFKFFPHWNTTDWQELRPDTMIGEVHNGAYFLRTASGTFRLDLKSEATRALTKITDDNITAMHESSHGRLLLATSQGIVAWNKGGAYQTAKWERWSAGRGALRAASAVDILATGAYTTTVLVDGVSSTDIIASGDHQGRVCPTRGRSFGVKIHTTGEVAQVIIGASIAQINAQ